MARASTLALLALLAAAACNDDDEKPVPADAGVVGNDAAPTTPGDASTPPPSDSGPKSLAACLDRPTVSAAPSGTLPCELIPPGFSL